jgi:hypothetical protein
MVRGMQWRAQRWVPAAGAAAGIVLAVAAAYAPVLRAGFVYDDRPYVVNNPAVTAPTLEQVFGRHFPPGRRDQGLYRPLLTLSYALDHRLSGGGRHWALTAHVHNLLLHAAACLLLGFALSRGGRGGAAAWLAAMCVALHPVLTESVAWVSARSELLAGLFAAAGLALLLLPAGRPAPGVKSAGLAVLTAAAILAKESAVMLPAAWAAAFWCMGPERPTPARVVLVTAPAALVAVTAVAVRLALSGGLAPELHAYAGVDAGVRYRFIGMALWRYVRLLAWPAGLTVHWPPMPSRIDNLRAAAGFAALLALGGTAVYGCCRRRAWAAAAGWPVLTLFVYTNLAVPIGAIMAERFLYMPAMGLAMLAAAGAAALKHRRLPRRLVAALLALAIAAGGVQTFRRASAWRDDVTLWRAALETEPDNLVAHMALLFYLCRAGDAASLDEARRRWPALEAAVNRLPPAMLTSTMNARLQWIIARLRATDDAARAPRDGAAREAGGR